MEQSIKVVFKDCKSKCFISIIKWCYVYKIMFVNTKNTKNDNFVVSSDDGAIKFKSTKFFRIALGDINNLTVKIFATV